MPPETNEMGAYVGALSALLKAYGKSLFDVVMYDAGACSLANAAATIAAGLDYVFCLRGGQQELQTEAHRLLASRPEATAQQYETRLEGDEIVERWIWTTAAMAGWLDWTHLSTVIRLRCKRTTKGTGAVMLEDRYYMTSLPQGRLTPAQWLELIRRRRWSIGCFGCSILGQCHNTWDKIFREDHRPWLTRPNGMVAVMVLRRIAYNIVAIFRPVTCRGERKRAQPWTELLQELRDALIRVTQEQLEGLRRRAVCL